MRRSAIFAALVCATAFVILPVAPVNAAKCYTPQPVLPTRTPLYKLPPPHACFLGRIENFGGVDYCVSCWPKGFQVSPEGCVAPCKSGYIWISALNRCCAGSPPPPPPIK